jgi:hypothetical protein
MISSLSMLFTYEIAIEELIQETMCTAAYKSNNTHVLESPRAHCVCITLTPYEQDG